MGQVYNQKDIAGQKFNMLTAVELVERRPTQYKSGRNDIEYYWLFKCDCGQLTITRRDRVTAKKNPIRSCGCQANLSKFKGIGELSQSQWYHIQKNAKVRGIRFDLQIEDAWELFLRQDGKCALTGWDISFAKRGQKWYDGTASLDRVDSKQDYRLSNVQWLHKRVNISKWDYTTLEFIDICMAVADYRVLKGD